MLSGRIGFELVQKAVVSGVAAVVAVGAPTSLALSLAEDAGLLLVGFTRAGRCVVYTGADRVRLSPACARRSVGALSYR